MSLELQKMIMSKLFNGITIPPARNLGYEYIQRANAQQGSLLNTFSCILSRNITAHSNASSISWNLNKTDILHKRTIHTLIMTNKPNGILIQNNVNSSCPANSDKSIRVYNGLKQPNTSSTTSMHTLAHASNFRDMAGIQKLATEPTREHIENIRNIIKQIKAKDNDNQRITLVKDEQTGIAKVCIQSAAKNGISGKMMCDFLDVIDELYSWNEGRGVIIYGHDGFFCSGGDLVSVREMANYEDGLRMATLMQYNLIRLQTLPMITIALIQGKAIGGGAEIAVTADLRLMTNSAKMGYVHCRVGIVAAWGGGARLVQLVGPSKAIELMSSGRLVDAEEALKLGLVNQTIDDSQLSDKEIMQEATRYLESHLVGAKSTIIAMKGIVNAARTLPLEKALVAEKQILSSTWGKQPHIDALNSNVRHRDG